MTFTPAPQEILDLAQEWVHAGGVRNIEFVEANAVAPTPDAIHTIPSGGGAGISLAQFVGHLRELPARETTGTSAAGFVHGDTAWVTFLITGDMPDDGIVTIRATIILARVDSAWRVVHCHVSEPVTRNAEGYRVTS